jgi:hypothetical protein
MMLTHKGPNANKENALPAKLRSNSWSGYGSLSGHRVKHHPHIAIASTPVSNLYDQFLYVTLLPIVLSNFRKIICEEPVKQPGKSVHGFLRFPFLPVVHKRRRLKFTSKKLQPEKWSWDAQLSKKKTIDSQNRFDILTTCLRTLFGAE